MTRILAHKKESIIALTGAASILIAISLCYLHDPYLAPDLSRMHVPRLLETADFVLKNPFDIQYFSRFCAGMPAYGNPQNAMFSLNGLLVLLLPAKLAIALAWTIYYAAGLIGCFRLLRLTGCSASVALAGSVLFVLNGYTFSHMAAGHTTYQGFLLIPLLLWLLYSGRTMARPLAAGALLATMIYAGDHMSLPLAALSIVLACLLPHRPSVKSLLVCFVCAVLVSASRLTAIFSVLEIMYHDYTSHLRSSLAEAIFASLKIIFFRPETNPAYDPAGWWEYSAFVSPLCLLPILIRARTLVREVLPLRAYLPLLIFGLALLAFSGGYAPLVSIAHRIPLLSSLWVVSRFAALLVLPIVALFAVALQRDARREQLAPLFAALFLLSFLVVFGPIMRNCNRSQLCLLWPKTLAIDCPAPPITEIKPYTGSPLELTGASRLPCYEAMYGYHLEGFRGDVQQGPIWEVRNGRYNFMNPACLSYPAANECAVRWERVRVSDSDNLRLLLENKATGWKVSAAQRAANVVSLISLIVLLFACPTYYLASKRNHSSL